MTTSVALSATPRTSPLRLVRVVFVVYVLACAALLAASYLLAGRSVVHPLDDAYIHFSIARTIAEHGSYGLQPGAFSTPASSLLWPFLLAACDVVGVPLSWGALGLGFASGAITLAVFAHVFEAGGLRGGWLAGYLTFAGALVPLVPMVLLGMEHAAHIAAVVGLAAFTLRDPRTLQSPRSLGTLFALAALAMSLRYETGFVVVPLVLVTLHARNVRGALALALGAAAPAGAFAAFFASHGAPLLPQSVLLKRTVVALPELPALLLQRASQHPHVPALLVSLALIAWFHGDLDARARRWLFTAGVTLALHAVFAQLGWLYRYESYAVALTLIALVLAAARPWKGPQLAHALGGLLLLPLALRMVYAFGALPKASKNVREQQREVAAFVHSFSDRGETTVAVNDVGAISYFGGATVLDLMGLADLDVARARRMRIDVPLSMTDVDRFTTASGASLAVVYEPWFRGAIPPSWIELERWRIEDNRVCAFDTVTFFATRPEQAAPLRLLLALHRTKLPAGVQATPVP